MTHPPCNSHAIRAASVYEQHPAGSKPDVPIVTFAPGDKADLKPGTKIFIGASKKLPDGTLQAARVNYGKDGLTPPM